MRRVLYVVVAIILIAVGWFALRSYLNQWSHDDLVLSKATTFITSPLDDLGYPDYVAALNERASEGVTPENNAAVLVLEAAGPSEVSLETRAEFFHLLGVKPLPEEGNYFESWTKYTEQILATEDPVAPQGRNPDAEAQFEEQHEKALERPWARNEFPDLARWLDANEKCLEKISEASKRTRYYVPVVRRNESDLLMNTAYPLVQPMRQTGQALAIRAMLRLSEGNIDAARDDLLACRRLGRLVAQQPMLIDGLVGIALDWLGFKGEVQLIAEAKPNADQCRRWRKQLAELPPMSPIIDKIDIGDRFVFLDAICNSAKFGPEMLSRGDNEGSGEPLPLATTKVDWNVPLRMANSWTDRLVDAGRIADAPVRAKAITEFEAELEAMTSTVKEPWSIVKAFFSRRVASEKIGQIMVGLMLPALSTALEAEWRNQTQETMIQVALAVGEFKAEHGKYPESLDQLVPRYLDEAPRDSFGRRPFVFGPIENGYVLYSVGKNGRDDSGKTMEDDGQSDDWVIRIPPEVPVAPNEN